MKLTKKDIEEQPSLWLDYYFFSYGFVPNESEIDENLFQMRESVIIDINTV